jgi:hypothetical protein
MPSGIDSSAAGSASLRGQAGEPAAGGGLELRAASVVIRLAVHVAGSRACRASEDPGASPVVPLGARIGAHRSACCLRISAAPWASDSATNSRAPPERSAEKVRAASSGASTQGIPAAASAPRASSASVRVSYLPTSTIQAPFESSRSVTVWRTGRARECPGRHPGRRTSQPMRVGLGSMAR